MKKWMTIALMLAVSTALVADDAPLKFKPEPQASSPVVTPDWAVDPIGKDPTPKAPSSEMMKNKHAAAVVIGTIATITIGLLVSGHNTGKHPAQ